MIPLIAALAIGSGLAMASLPAEAAQSVPPQRPSAPVEKNVTAVAAKDMETTGSVQTAPADTGTCDRSRKRLFVEGEGWIVRKVTTCY